MSQPHDDAPALAWVRDRLHEAARAHEQMAAGGTAAIADAARRRGMVSVALTGGDGGALGRLADVHVNVPHTSTPRVQEVQLSVLHVICELVEQACATSEESSGSRTPAPR